MLFKWGRPLGRPSSVPHPSSAANNGRAVPFPRATVVAYNQQQQQDSPGSSIHPRLSNATPRTFSSVEISTENESAPTARFEPSAEVLNTWRNVSAVCFDVDLTLTRTDGIDGLAEFKGKGAAVAALTNAAMEGTLSLEESLFERMKIIDPTPSDIQAFLAKLASQHAVEDRLVPDALALVTTLQSRGVDVFLISGGFRIMGEMIMPVARYLGIPPENVFANRMFFQSDDETGLPTKFAGFDLKEPTARQGGKPAAIASLRAKHPYATIAMVGDGITDLEAVQVSGGADLFIGYGGVVQRAPVMHGADWFVTDHLQLIKALQRHRVAFIGSGAWACAAAKMVARNALRDDPSDMFEDQVIMWCYEEVLEDGRKLTDVINETKENVKYFPGIKLGDNMQAVPSLEDAVRDATMIVFVTPHQFVHGICKQLKGKVRPDAIAISLTKGMRVREDGPQLISEMVRKNLNIDCSVLMGANIASDIGNEQLSEATIGYAILENAQLFYKVFATPYFHIEMIPDVAGVEMAGTLKNIVAVGAGLIEGLGYGPNTKAAVIRRGLKEMMLFSKKLYPTIRDETFFSSCGIADVIASSYGGRNRLVAKAFVEAIREGRPRSFEELEASLLKGQKLQGVLTSDEVQAVIRRRGWESEFPLFSVINKVVHNELPPEALTLWEDDEALHTIKARGMF